MLCQIVGNVLQQFMRIATCKRVRKRADQHCAGAKAFDGKAQTVKLIGGIFQPVAGGFVQFHNFWYQHRLTACHGFRCARSFQAFEHQSLMRGVLIDQHQTVFRFRYDIGVRNLPTRNAEGVICIFR